MQMNDNRELCVLFALFTAAGTSTPALADGPEKPAPRLIPPAAKLVPKQVAGARRLPDGRLVPTTGWIDYAGRSTRDRQASLAFDNFEPTATTATGTDPGYPTDGQYGLDCGLGSSRWFFGTSYCNMYYTNDIQEYVDDRYQGESSLRVEYAWYFSCAVESSSEPCLVAVFTAEDFDDTCAGPDFGSPYGGVVYDFGTLACNPGGYYFADVDLISELGHTLPSNGGAYQVFFLSAFDTGTGSATLSSCAQPMLWGTKPGNPGRQGPVQWDDADHDMRHTAPDECSDLGIFALCPDPLGGMFCFYGDTLAPHSCYADCDGSDSATVNDFICFQTEWRRQGPYGDYDSSGTWTVNDFIKFQAEWKQFQLGECVR